MYGDFSYIYDKLMTADYKRWLDYYKRIFKKFGSSPKLVLDLGCGTGKLCSMMADEGFDVIGLDASPEMLSIAKGRRPELLFINMDMTDFELYGTVDAAVSSLDCVNYIDSGEGIFKMFKLLENYLNPGGLFIFDINTKYKLSKVLGSNTFVSDDENIFLVWENDFFDNTATFDLTFFVKENDSYKRYGEIQHQYAYGTGELKALARRAGLEVLGVYDEFSFNAPMRDSERLFFVLGKKESIF